MPEPVLTLRALNRATLARQMLLRREKIKPVAAMERLVGLQAQLARPPFVGLWSRIEGFRREDLIRAVERKDAVRATMMRATIHLVSRRDFLSFRPVLQPMLTRASASQAKGIDIDRLLAAAHRYFEEPHTFVELREHLKSQFPTLDERAMAYAVRTHLPLVQTPGAEERWGYHGMADFILAESWLDEPISADAAPHALALRYFAAFGPAAVHDFHAWSGLSAARKWIDELRPRLRTFRDERGRELFDLPKAPRPNEDEEAPVRFLPEFDNLLLGHADRTRVLASEHKPALATNNLFIPGVFLVDGFAAGMWKADQVKRKTQLRIIPFERLSRKTITALEEEAGKLQKFLEPEAEGFEVVFQPLTRATKD